MKKITLFFVLCTSFVFSQKKIIKTFETQLKELTVSSSGLDFLVLKNSNTKFVKVHLEAEDYDDQLIELKEKNESLEVAFYFEGSETREVIFRKFITKRLQRASAIIEVPKDMVVTVYGENVDIESKDLENELSIYIDNGIVKLNNILRKTLVKLYAGNVYGIKKDNNIKISSNLGKIEVDKMNFTKKFESNHNSDLNGLIIESIKANIFITTQ